MSEAADLDRLAALAGIEAEYWDIWGNHHKIGDRAKRRILGSLGVPADTKAEIAASLKRLDEDPWRRPLPPVVIVQAGMPLRVPVMLRPPESRGRLTVQIVQENGTSHVIPFRPAEQQPASRRTVAGAEVARYEIPVPVTLPLGYHAFRILELGNQTSGCRIIVAPGQCYLPAPLDSGGRVWGLSAQLYSLRRDDNWGIGDFTDLENLVQVSARLGARVIGLNPLHALFSQEPERASPYSPSSRIFLNPIYLDVTAIPGFAECQPAQAALKKAEADLEACRQGDIVDYPRVLALKVSILEPLFRHFRERNADDDAIAQFERFRKAGGEPLRRFALFEALSEKFPRTPWQWWPESLRNPTSPDVETFAQDNKDRVDFFCFLQWQSDRQLAAAQRRAKELGLGIGLYRDLAVGCAMDSADAWCEQDCIVQSAKIGCPPDPFNMLGQDWGVPPLHPLSLREEGYEPFIAILRANMRHAGAIRIDHVMGLLHLFWIPIDGKPADGAYVQYPFEELLAVLALESTRNRCLIIGEDLGTVPPGFRERMTAMNVLSYRVLYFEKDGPRFKKPTDYPDLALACVTTHDLPTLVGFWKGADIDIKHRLKLYPSAEAEQGERQSRLDDRKALLQALASERLLPAGLHPEKLDGQPMTAPLAAALHEYLARSPSRILLVQVDDLAEELDQINLPGTVDERPNWRRKLSLSVSGLASSPVAAALGSGLATRSLGS
jgi:4-alpha-glucanotransferase